MDIERARHNMIEQQIRTWEVLDQTVLDLLYVVRREEFVPAAHRALAFSDLEIPLGPNNDPGERMMFPKIEARIVQEVAPKVTDKVLEVGAGSGYMAALLGARAREVTTVEINSQLKDLAARNLDKAGIENVNVELGDGARGWARKAPYDVIVLSGSVPLLAQELLDQLAPNGRLFAVIGEPPVMSARLLTCVRPGSFHSIDLFETVLAPLRNAPQPKRFKF